MQAPRRLQLRRGNTAAVSTYLGAPGELIVNTDNNTLFVHDGTTVGGIPATTNTAAITSNVSALQSNVSTLTANAGAQAGSIAALTSNAASQAGLIADLTANAGVQAGAIVTANTAMKGYVDAAVAGIVIPEVYGNTNVAAYLTNPSTILSSLNVTTAGIAQINGTNPGSELVIQTGGSHNFNFKGTGNLEVPGSIIPTANVAYSLGNITHQWRDLFVSNNTIYIGGVPLSVDASGNLIVNGSVVGGNANVSQLWNAGKVVSLGTDGKLTFPGGKMTMQSGNSFGSIQGSANTSIIVYSGGSTGQVSLQWTNANPESNVAATAFSGVIVNGGNAGDVQIITGAYNPMIGNFDKTWNFGTNGNITLPTNTAAINYANGVNILSTIVGITSINASVSTSAINDESGDFSYGSLSYDYAVNGVTAGGFTINYSAPLVHGNVDVNVGNVIASNITTTNGIFWANGQAYSTGSNYSNINVASYLPTYSGNLSAGGYVGIAGQDGTTVVDFQTGAGTNQIITLGSDYTFSIKAGDGASNRGSLVLESGRNSRVRVNGSGSNVQVTAGNGTSSGTWTFNTNGNLTLPSNIAAINYANGVSILSGLGSGGTTYSNTNVVAYLTTANITTTGNITAAWLSGNISITGNVVGTSPNVTIQAGSYSSTFNNQGNVTLPNLAVSGNVISGGYFLGNGALLTGIVSGGGTTYSNANVASYLPTYSGNVGGNINIGGALTVYSANSQPFSFNDALYVVGGLTAGANISAGGRLVACSFATSTNINSGAIQTNGGIGAWGNIYAGQNVVATGNVSATNFIGNGSQLTGLNTLYLLEAYASVTYTLPGSFTEDTCRYSVVSSNVNVSSSWFNTSTYTFTPQKAGYWEITASYDVYRNSEASLAIKKNLDIVAAAGSFNAVAQQVTKIIYLNGSTDYINIINVGGAALSRSQYDSRSWFQARWIGA